MPPKHDRRRVDKLLVACAVFCTLALATFAIVAGPTVIDAHHLASENAQRIRDIAVLTRENARLTHEIQTERVRNVRRNCRETNQRHDATIRKLNELVAATSSAQRKRAQASRAGTVALLEAIVPHRNCRRLARQQVPSGTP